MSKRALLWMVGLVAFFFTYVAAVNVKQISAISSLYGGISISVYCKGMWNFTQWFQNGCSDSLPSRLGVLSIGVVALLIFGYFAEKRHTAADSYGGARTRLSRPSPAQRSKGLAHHVTSISPFSLRRAHSVYKVDGEYVCSSANCDFVCDTLSAAERHEANNVPADPIYGFDEDLDGLEEDEDEASPSLPPTSNGVSSPELETPEFKACPDCAEDVRFAARKCRFCGYQFSNVVAMTKG